MEAEANTRACPACGTITVGAAKYCSVCGIPLDPAATPPAPSPSKWYHRVWFVLLMLTPFALGPFGLPLLWKSPQFSRRAKVILTLVTATWTIWFVIYFMTSVLPKVQQAIEQINSSLQAF